MSSADDSRDEKTRNNIEGKKKEEKPPRPAMQNPDPRRLLSEAELEQSQRGGDKSENKYDRTEVGMRKDYMNAPPEFHFKKCSCNSAEKQRHAGRREPAVRLEPPGFSFHEVRKGGPGRGSSETGNHKTCVIE